MKWGRSRLYPKQQAAIFTDRRFTVLWGSTKSGKTHGALVWLFEHAWNVAPGRKPPQLWWIAPVHRQARIAFRRAVASLKRAGVKVYINRSDQSIVLPWNGARIVFLSGKNADNLYGEEVQAVVIDEAPRVSDASWAAVRSTLSTTQGPVLCVGNVTGYHTWVHRLCESDYTAEATLTAYDAADAGVLPRSEIEIAKDTLPLPEFEELYLCIPRLAGSNPLGTPDQITACIHQLSEESPVVWGIDLAKHVDYTAVSYTHLTLPTKA